MAKIQHLSGPEGKKFNAELARLGQPLAAEIAKCCVEFYKELCDRETDKYQMKTATQIDQAITKLRKLQTISTDNCQCFNCQVAGALISGQINALKWAMGIDGAFMANLNTAIKTMKEKGLG